MCESYDVHGSCPRVELRRAYVHAAAAAYPESLKRSQTCLSALLLCGSIQNILHMLHDIPLLLHALLLAEQLNLPQLAEVEVPFLQVLATAQFAYRHTGKEGKKPL
jgi:hypothetical protein